MKTTLYYLSTLPLGAPDDLFDIHPERTFATCLAAVKEARRVDKTSKELGWSRAYQWYVHQIEATHVATTKVDLVSYKEDKEA